MTKSTKQNNSLVCLFNYLPQWDTWEPCRNLTEQVIKSKKWKNIMSLISFVEQMMQSRIKASDKMVRKAVWKWNYDFSSTFVCKNCAVLDQCRLILQQTPCFCSFICSDLKLPRLIIRPRRFLRAYIRVLCSDRQVSIKDVWQFYKTKDRLLF